jgi:diguanylate cyclase (GGDEF)-like protein
MRIRGLFLHSRVARRTFWVLVAAALLPLLLFGMLASQAYLDARERDQHRAATEFLKHIGLRAYDRLSAARATLAAHAAGGRFQAPRVDDPAVQTVLSRLATVDLDGRVGGDASLAGDWHRARGPAAADDRSVWWLPKMADAPGRVFIVRPDPDGRGHWLAEVAPAFLWADFAEDGPAAQLCLTDAAGERLRCPHPPAEDAPAWPLFMKAGFGSPDWLLQGHRPYAQAAGLDGVLRVGAAGGAATLLLITILGLILVRRTMVPLEQLMAGTQRLAAGDWSVRVAARGRDEFGLLGQAFNAMAERLGRQWQANAVQATIDGEILGGLDAARVMQPINQRLAVLAPGSAVAVVVRSLVDERWRLFRPDLPAGRWIDGPLDIDATTAVPGGIRVDEQRAGPLPPWLAQMLPPQARPVTTAYWVPAHWQGGLVALLLIASPEPPTLDREALREVEMLRDRCAVGYAAALREHQLVERAVRDELTGLLNRHGLHDACDRWLSVAGGPAPFTVLFVDLDGFKEVNDSMGHSTGDQLLCTVADRLRSALPEAGVLARPGGDEFVMLLPAAVDADALAADLCRRIAQPFALRGQVVHIGASIGLASSPAEGIDRDELMRRADLAMYAAKGDGRGRWRRYADTMDAQANERAWIARDLRRALETGVLEVHYQPRLDLRSGRTGGAEALVRWPHPERGMIPPMRFIPVAEESDLIVAIGDFVMDAALAQCRRWRDQGLDIGRVAVNVSARQLRDRHFTERVLAAVARHRLQPQDLEIELTESLFAGETSAVEQALAPLRARGVCVALDDFGTGFSSLSALKHLPVDVMKIDRSFVIDLGLDRSADAVVRSVIALARDLGKRVVAEGVETALQQQRLLALGCDEVQGYRYAKPLSATDFMAKAGIGFDAPLRERPISASEAA